MEPKLPPSPPKKHELKTQPKTFEALGKGRNYDVRKNDRNFAEGDTVIFREWSYLKNEYTWRVKIATITSVLPFTEIPGYGESPLFTWCAIGLKFHKNA